MIAPTNGRAANRVRHALSGAAPPPHDQDAEQAVIGSVMLDPRIWPDVSQLLSADDFHGVQHRKIWSAIDALVGRGEPIDAVMLCDELKRRGDLDEVGVSYLDDVVASVPTPSHAAFYADVVRRHADRRRVIDAGRVIVQAGQAIIAIGADGSFTDGDRAAELRHAAAGAQTIITALPIAPAESVADAQPDRYQTFPVRALPQALRDLATAGAAALDCDTAYFALPALSMLAAAIGTTRRIEREPGVGEPSALWTAIVGESGTRKTPALKLALGPVYARQARAQDELGATPLRCYTTDTTVEALARVLGRHPRGILVAVDELAGWLRSHDQYRSRPGPDAARWLAMHDGDTVVIDRRSTDQPLYVRDALVSITGGIQPEVLRHCLAGEHMVDGLAHRLMMAWPPRRMNYYRHAGIAREVEAGMRSLLDGIYDTLDYARTDDGPQPRIVRLAPAAKREYIDWWNRRAEIDHALADGHLLAAAAKVRGRVLRLALVLHCARQVETAETADADVDVLTLRAAVAIAEWAWRETTRIYGMVVESPADTHRRKLVEIIAARPGRSITPRDLARGPRKYRGPGGVELAEADLQGLVDAGMARWSVPPSCPGGGRPPRLCALPGDSGDGDATPKNATETEVSSPSPPSPDGDGRIGGEIL